MYRLIVESLLGIKLEGDRLRFEPCLPPKWKAFALRYRYRETYYQIAVRRTEVEGSEETGAETYAAKVTVDGVAVEGNFIHLADDRQEHRVEVFIVSRRPIAEMTSA